MSITGIVISLPSSLIVERPSRSTVTVLHFVISNVTKALEN